MRTNHIETSKPIIISVGGSLIIPNEVDTGFLSEFRQLILSHVKKGKRFILIAGGGSVNTRYNAAARAITAVSDEDLDWLGISFTRANAELLRVLFSDKAYPCIIIDPTKRVRFREKVMAAAGWKPGCSSDQDAVLLAKTYGVGTIINLSNFDYVCDKDPNRYPDAKILKKVTWKELRKILPAKWTPRLHSPFDPTAARTAQKLGLTVITINGKKIDRLAACLSGKPFEGTTIIP